MSPLRWTCKSTAHLAAALTRAGPRVRARTVAALLKELDYRLQGLRKTKEGTAPPDRNAPFEHLAAQGEAFQERGQPVVSGDTKKKEGGRLQEWRTRVAAPRGAGSGPGA
jgi:hypothetical protein